MKCVYHKLNKLIDCIFVGSIYYSIGSIEFLLFCCCVVCVRVCVCLCLYIIHYDAQLSILKFYLFCGLITNKYNEKGNTHGPKQWDDLREACNLTRFHSICLFAVSCVLVSRELRLFDMCCSLYSHFYIQVASWVIVWH